MRAVHYSGARRGWGVGIVAICVAVLAAPAPAVADLIVPGGGARRGPRRPDPPPPSKPAPKAAKPFTLRSPAFKPRRAIPEVHSCDGADSSPPLTWTAPPPGTQALALIVDDPDAPDPKAPKGTWVHWVVWDLPADLNALPDDASRKGLPLGAKVGRNDWDRTDWGGPCPPIGRHRYVFRLLALDQPLGALAEGDRADKAALLRRAEGHVLGEATLIGTYQRRARPAPKPAKRGSPD